MKFIIRFFFLLIVLAGLGGGYLYFFVVNAKVIDLQGKDSTFVYIPTNSKFEDLVGILNEAGILINEESFRKVSGYKKYDQKVRPGKYLIKNGTKNNDLINQLRSGIQVPVKVTFNNVRTKEQLAGKIGAQLEADSARIIQLINDNSFLSNYGMNRYNSVTLFIPNTYEFYWNTSAEKFIQRMAKEYKRFWNAERAAKAKKLNLSRTEIITLASIVEEEQGRVKDEWPVIAGLYLNRIKKGMKLQSDPTVKYAVGDFKLKRILHKHLKVDSKYNTYKYKGLPPGPIRFPDSRVVDAVLNYKKHNYIYMCASSDGTIRHKFATTYKEHQQNSRAYHNYLNKRKIFN